MRGGKAFVIVVSILGFIILLLILVILGSGNDQSSVARRGTTPAATPTSMPVVPVTPSTPAIVSVTARQDGVRAPVTRPETNRVAEFVGKGGEVSELFRLPRGRYVLVLEISGNDRRFVPDTWQIEVLRIPDEVALLVRDGRGVSGRSSAAFKIEASSRDLWFRLNVGDDANWSVSIQRVGELPSPTPDPKPTMRVARRQEATATPTLLVTPSDTPATGPTQQVRASPTVAPTSTPAPNEFQIHIVQPGDTLVKIAERYGTTVVDLIALNAIDDPSLISPGQEIRIRVTPPSQAMVTSSPNETVTSTSTPASTPGASATKMPSTTETGVTVRSQTAATETSASFGGKGGARSKVFQLHEGRYDVVLDISGNDRRFVPDTWELEVYRRAGEVLLLSGAGRGASDSWYGQILVEDRTWDLWFSLDVGDAARWTVNIEMVGDLPAATRQSVRRSQDGAIPSTTIKSASATDPTPIGSPTPSPIRLGLIELFDEYEENKVRANSRLRYRENGRVPLSTWGYISRVEDLYAVVEATREDYPDGNLRCYYADTEVAYHLSRGQAVSITGRVSGKDEFSGSIQMYACKFDGIVLESKPTVAADDLRASVVQVFCLLDLVILSIGHKGTGLILDPLQGIILTVHHVVSDENGCQKIEVEVPGIDGRVPAIIDEHCASIDRAHLRIPRTSLADVALRPIVRASAPAQADQDIYFWGYGSDELRLEFGVVQDVFGTTVVTDAYAVSGDSGAGVFNEYGHLLGTVSRGNQSDRTIFTGDEC